MRSGFDSGGDDNHRATCSFMLAPPSYSATSYQCGREGCDQRVADDDPNATPPTTSATFSNSPTTRARLPSDWTTKPASSSWQVVWRACAIDGYSRSRVAGAERLRRVVVHERERWIELGRPAVVGNNLDAQVAVLVDVACLDGLL